MAPSSGQSRDSGHYKFRRESHPAGTTCILAAMSTQLQNPPTVAFIGLGIMGLPMAGHLLKAGCRLTVHSRTKSKASELLNAGATWAETPAAAAAGADVVFVCVTDTPDVEAVLLGTNGVIRST